jgi:hypothetical protein
MEPRNILLRKDSSAISGDSYKLVAIIDWEMAGFYPDGLEDMQKTAGFGPPRSCGTGTMPTWISALFNHSGAQR